MRRLTALASLTLVVVLGLAHPVSGQTTEWPVYGGDASNTRYSALDRITPANVGKLKVAWALQGAPKWPPIPPTVRSVPAKP